MPGPPPSWAAPSASAPSNTVPEMVDGPQTPKFLPLSDCPEPIEPVFRQLEGKEQVHPACPKMRILWLPFARPVRLYWPSEFVTEVGSPLSRALLLLLSEYTVQPATPCSPA